MAGQPSGTQCVLHTCRCRPRSPITPLSLKISSIEASTVSASKPLPCSPNIAFKQCTVCLSRFNPVSFPHRALHSQHNSPSSQQETPSQPSLPFPFHAMRAITVAIPCPAIPWPAIPCPAILCPAIPCHAILCLAILCPAINRVGGREIKLARKSRA